MKVPDTATHCETSVVLQRLKAATRAEHDAIEVALDLMAPGFSLLDYHRRLRRYHGFYASIEPLIAAAANWPHWGIEISARAKTPWLAADLVCLAGRSELAGTALADLPLCSDLPPLDTPAAAFGCLYVLEGATLGGRVISRHIEHALGLNATDGARFFSGYGEQTGSMWKAFRASLSAFVETSPEDDKVVASAIATFVALRTWCASDEPGHDAFEGGALDTGRHVSGVY